MPRYENPDFILDEEDVPKKKDFSGVIFILTIALVILFACNIKDYPAGERDFHVTNIDVVANGQTSTHITYVIDNWEISSYEIHVVYGNYDQPTLHVKYYKIKIFNKISFGSSQPTYVLYLPNGYKF